MHSSASLQQNPSSLWYHQLQIDSGFLSTSVFLFFEHIEISSFFEHIDVLGFFEHIDISVFFRYIDISVLSSTSNIGIFRAHRYCYSSITSIFLFDSRGTRYGAALSRTEPHGGRAQRSHQHRRCRW